MTKSSEKILEVAEKLFNEYGYTAVGVDLIRDKSGSSKTTMYTHFKSKQSLITEVLRNRDNRFRTSLRTFVDNGEQSIKGKITSLFQWHFNWFKSTDYHGCMFVKITVDMPQENPVAVNIAMQHKLWLEHFITGILLGTKEIRFLSDIIFNILEGLINRFVVFGYDESIAQNSLYSVLKVYDFVNPNTLRVAD